MNFFTIFTILAILVLGGYSVNSAHAEIDHLVDIEFFQTGVLNTLDNEFQLSNELVIREFSNGNIVRVSGQTVEGFPYITYSKISNDRIDTEGVIFVNGKFTDLLFKDKLIQKQENIEKKDDLAILVQYSSQVYSRTYAFISMKIFDEEKNPLNDYNQKDGRISNVNINVLVIDGRSQEFFSTNGTTNDSGFYETKFWIPDNYRRDTLTVTIDAENENSESSKILKVSTRGVDK
jgi:hypothetical protein